MQSSSEKTEWVVKMQEFFREAYEKAEGEDKTFDAVETVMETLKGAISLEKLEGKRDNSEWFAQLVISKFQMGLGLWMVEKDNFEFAKIMKRNEERKRARRGEEAEEKEVVEVE